MSGTTDSTRAPASTSIRTRSGVAVAPLGETALPGATDSAQPSARTSATPPARSMAANGAASPSSTTRTRVPNSRARRACGVSIGQHARAQDADARCQTLHLVEVVRAHHHGPVLGLQLAHQIADAAGAFGVQSRRRLVQQHDDRIVQERPRQRNPLAETLGQLSRVVAGAVAQAEPFQRGVHGAAGLGEPVQPGVGHQVLPHAQPVPQARRFGEQPHQAAEALRVAGRDRLALQFDAPGGGRDESGQHAERGGLAGAVRPDQSEGLATAEIRSRRDRPPCADRTS